MSEALSLAAVDRLFDRLATNYGREWSSKWDGMEVGKVKAAWADELSPWSNREHGLPAIAWALENLPPRAPGLPAFKELLRQAPRAASEPEALPRRDPAGSARVAAELATLREAFDSSPPRQFVDRRAWAHAIVGRANAGGVVAPAVLRMAQQAIRHPVAAE